MTDETGRLLSAAEVAQRLAVGVRRVRLIPARELPYVQLAAAGTRRYDEADVAAYLKARTIRS